LFAGPTTAAQRSRGTSASVSRPFLVHVGVPAVDRLHAFLVDRLSARKEVVGFRTSVIFRHVRKPVLEPLV
jgi:hypothetical protein